jgi:hypothetical protein
MVAVTVTDCRASHSTTAIHYSTLHYLESNNLSMETYLETVGIAVEDERKTCGIK